METVLQDFFAKKNIGSENGTPIEQWVQKASGRAGQLIMGTHNGKYTHTGAGKEVSCIAAERSPRPDGFLRTGTCRLDHVDSVEKMDCLGNAAVLYVCAFLSLVLSDGKTVFDHVHVRSKSLQKDLELDDATFEEVCQGFEAIKPIERDMQTSDLIKQVYFPVGDGYHLLSLLTPSGLVTELKKRLDALLVSQDAKDGRDARRKQAYHEAYSEIYGLTEITFGGANAQNVGALNVSNHGVAHLLSSVPPIMESRQVRLPRTDFFANCLWKREFANWYEQLQKIFDDERNTIDVRDNRKALFQSIIERIIKKSWDIRNVEGGWSKRDYYGRLPEYQKIWLDAARESERKASDTWLDRVVDAMAAWVCNYSKQTEQKLGDEEFRYVKLEILDVKEALQ